ncbi:MAG: hypothetical protein ACRC9K_18185 [Afipia sp.]
MTLLSRTKLTGCAVAAGAILAVGMAVVPPARAADDLPIVDDIRIPMPRVLEDDEAPPAPQYERPYYERPYSQQPYRPGPYAPGPYAAIPSARYNRPAVDARPVLPPTQVVAVLRSTGYSPLGQMTQRGWIYTVAAIDRNGDDGRLIIDARTGRIMRFIPAMAVDERLNDRMAMVYGPPGPPPVTYAGYENRRGSLLDLRRAPRPPSPVPHAAQRNAPKTASRVPQSTAAPAQQAAAPTQQAAEPSAAAKPAPANAVVENKSAAATVGAATAAAPSTLKLWPTQAMPDVQPLE